jgi:hypothetical protein
MQFFRWKFKTRELYWEPAHPFLWGVWLLSSHSITDATWQALRVSWELMASSTDGVEDRREAAGFAHS